MFLFRHSAEQRDQMRAKVRHYRAQDREINVGMRARVTLNEEMPQSEKKPFLRWGKLQMVTHCLTFRVPQMKSQLNLRVHQWKYKVW